MLDLIANAKKQNLSSEVIGAIEVVYEHSLKEIAEAHFLKSRDKNWKKSYAFAASYLNNESLSLASIKNTFPPILDIHPEAKLPNLKTSHFLPTMLSKGGEAVIDAFLNIERWNYKNAKSDWARNLIEQLVSEYNNYATSNMCHCVQCQTKIEHIRDIPCNQVKCPNCGAFMFGANCTSELVIPPRPEDVFEEGEHGEDDFVVDLDKVRRTKNESPRPMQRVRADEEFICACPKCGLEMQSTGRACETIECPKCPGTYLMVKDNV